MLEPASPKRCGRMRVKISRTFTQIGVLCWKNFILWKRNLRATFGQIVSPIAVILLIVFIQLIANYVLRQTNEHPDSTAVNNTLTHCLGKGCYNLLYAPKGVPWVEKLVQNIAHDSNMNFTDTFMGFGDGNPKGIEDFFKDNHTISEYILNHPNTTNFAIIFSTTYLSEEFRNATLPNDLGYWLFYNDTLPIETISSTLVTIDRHISLLKSKTGTPNITVQTKPFPKTLYRFSLLDISSVFGGNLLYIPPMIIFFTILIDVVGEKECRLRLGMKMMGLYSNAYWISWVIQGLVFAIAITIVMYLTGLAAQMAFFAKSNFFVIFFLFVEFTFAMVSMALFLATLISNSKTAQTVGYAIILAGFVFQSILTSSWGILIDMLWIEDVPGWVVFIRTLLRFYPPFNMAKIYSDVSALSSATLSPTQGRIIEGPGFSWSDLFVGRSFNLGKLTINVPPPSHSYGILFGNIALYMFLMWYFDNVLSSNQGAPKPLYFLFTPEYWGIRKRKTRYPDPSEIDDEQLEEDVEKEAIKALNSNDPNIVVSIRNLVKTYRQRSCCKSKGDLKAVNNLSFNIEEGEVFCLLGHNGAGKTTAINVLTGLFQPTSGTALICGHDINENIDDVQGHIGVCPQHDVLWEDLTAREHLRLFARVKNIPSGDIENEVNEKLKRVGLFDVADNVTKSYSGGMKRRLSIAISTIGDPKVIFLDEPSSGLDPLNKSAIWDMIQKLRNECAIILTTHSMEEAEILSNRVGIMAYGKLRAIGDSLYLKNKYGEGYRISMITEQEDSTTLADILQDKWPDLNIVDDLGIVIAGVPHENSDDIPNIIKFIDSSAIVKEWGISHSTLESVFLTVSKQNNFAFDDIDPEVDFDSDSDDIQISLNDSSSNIQEPLVNFAERPKKNSRPFRALIRKNLTLQLRQRFTNICQIATPVFIILILVLLRIIIKSQLAGIGDEDEFVPGVPFPLNLQAAMYADNFTIPDFPEDPDPQFFRPIMYSYWNEVKRKVNRDQGDNLIYLNSPGDSPIFPPVDSPEFPPAEPPMDGPQTNINCPVFLLYADSESAESPGFIDKDGNKKGMFSHVLQYPCIIEVNNTNGELEDKEIMIPYFDRRNSTYEIEDEIVTYLLKYNNESIIDVENPPLSYLLPDGHFNIHSLNTQEFTINYTATVNDHVTIKYHRRNNFTRSDITRRLTIPQGYYQLISFINRAFISESLLKQGIDNTPSSHMANLVVMSTMPQHKPVNVWIILEIFGTILYPMGLTLQLPLFLFILTLEKYERLREMMLSHGMKLWHYHITNYGFFYAIYTLVVIAFWIAGAVSGSRVFVKTHWSVLLILFIAWGFTLVSMAFFLSSLVNSPRVATVLGYSIALFGSITATVVSVAIYGPLPVSLKTSFPTWLYIWPQFSLSRAIYLLNDQCALKNECYGALHKIPWSNEFPRIIVGMFIASILYMILFLYMDAVLPRQYGVPKHPLLCLKSLFNKKKTKGLYQALDSDDNFVEERENDNTIVMEEQRVSGSKYDPYSPLVMSNLRKVHDNGKEAVKGLSLIVQRGECFGLLGENGAGKTTTISMLTGLYKPTSGWATISGHSIKTDIDKVHLEIGLCPQFDLLWSDLSVKEHLLFYARLKGISPSEEKTHVERILRNVGLYDARNKKTKSLSGGMKRRLSIAISLVGDSTIVFMDEPTTGLDPASRRQILKIIQKAKKDRAIILTTHAMDEAELLCTRVGIMANGSMRCLGTVQSLKNKLGDGYRLTINIDPQRRDEATGFIASNITHMTMVRSYKETIEYHVLREESITNLFLKMRAESNQHGIRDWAISQIGMNDVFHQVITESKKEDGLEE